MKNEDTCPGCGCSYGAFRTGYTFAEVRQHFWRNDSDPKTWINKRRGTVLGRWREIKIGMWEVHVADCLESVLKVEVLCAA